MAKITKKERIAQIEKQLASLKEEYQTKKAKREDQKSQWEKIKNLQKEIKDLEHQAQIAEKQTDYNKAAEIRYNTLPEKQKELAELENKEAENDIHNDIVEAEDIATIIAKRTGIPASCDADPAFCWRTGNPDGYGVWWQRHSATSPQWKQ